MTAGGELYMNKVHLVTCVDRETADIFENVCADSGVSVSAMLSALIDNFLESSGSGAQNVIRRAKQIRRGRPKAE